MWVILRLKYVKNALTNANATGGTYKKVTIDIVTTDKQHPEYGVLKIGGLIMTIGHHHFHYWWSLKKWY